MLITIAVALVCVAPTAVIALAFGIAKDGNPLRKEFWT